MSDETTCLLDPLLGAEIVGVHRVLADNPVLGERYIADSALVLVLADGRQCELLTCQSRTILAELTGNRSPFLMDLADPDPVPDPDQQLSLCPPTGEAFDRSPRLPVRVDRVIEVWAGRGDKAFLVAIMIDSPAEAGSPRLDLCVETDEIEIMTPEELADRLKEIERSYVAVSQRHCGR